MRWNLLPLLLFCLIGCAEDNPPARETIFRPPPAVCTYSIQSPDKIEIRAPEIPELHLKKAAVGEDGLVTFEGLGGFQAAGKSPDELATSLHSAVQRKHPGAKLNIDVCARSRHFFAYGYGVATQDKYTFVACETVTSALNTVGFDETIWPAQVRLVRPGKNGGPDRTILVDYGPMFDEGGKPADYLLEDGDILEVTRTPLRRKSNIPVTQPSAVTQGENTVRPCGKHE